MRSTKNIFFLFSDPNYPNFPPWGMEKSWGLIIKILLFSLHSRMSVFNKLSPLHSIIFDLTWFFYFSSHSPPTSLLYHFHFVPPQFFISYTFISFILLPTLSPSLFITCPYHFLYLLRDLGTLILVLSFFIWKVFF